MKGTLVKYELSASVGGRREVTMNERERRQLQAELVANREALLAVASDVDERGLARPTRNPGWAVRHVLAHVLASDADLIALLEAAGDPGTDPLRHHSFEEHEREMARWMDATPEAMAEELRERGDRWRELLAALLGPATEILVGASGWIKGEMKLLDVVGYWPDHYSQHVEDVRLALAEDRSGESR
jgi:hypothetical protein